MENSRKFKNITKMKNAFGKGISKLNTPDKESVNWKIGQQRPPN